MSAELNADTEVSTFAKENRLKGKNISIQIWANCLLISMCRTETQQLALEIELIVTIYYI